MILSSYNNTAKTAPPLSIAYYLDSVAQVRALSAIEREEAHSESSLESDRFLQAILSSDGVAVCRILYVTPESPGTVHELYRFQRNGVSIDVPAEGLHYYRLARKDFILPRSMRNMPTGARLYRHLPQVRAGSGVGAMRSQSPNETHGRTNRVLSLSGSLIRDPEQRVYQVPAPIPLVTQLYNPKSPDRWRAVHMALLKTGKVTPAVVMIRVQTSPLPSAMIRYAERAARLLGETPGDNSAPTPSPRQTLEAIATGQRAYHVTIEATGADILRAFQADTDSRSLVDHLPNLGQSGWQGSDEEARLTQLLDSLASCFTLEETTALLTPSITFHNMLPGVSHFSPPQLRTSEKSDRSRNADDDPQYDFPIGITAGGNVKTMNSVWMTTGCLLVGPPGTGKTTAAKMVVRRARQTQGGNLAINIIDPVGFEWLDIADELGARVIRFEPGGPLPLTFNPFWAPEHISLADHSATIAKLMTAIFPGNQMAQAYLTAMILGTYREKWRARRHEAMDLVAVCGADQRLYPETCPTFQEFLIVGPKWLEMQASTSASKQHAEDVEYFKLRGELIRTSLVAAVLSGDQPLYDQLNGSFILSLQAIGTREVKHALLAMILGLHLCSLGRETQPAASKLKRLLVLEESHELIGASSKQARNHELAEGATELICQMLVDVLRTHRKYGNGVLILDQSLSSLVDDVVKCCGNIMALRTPFPNDQDALAKQMGLSAVEARDLTNLETGECIAFLKGDSIPIRMKFDER